MCALVCQTNVGRQECCTYLHWTGQMGPKPDSPIAFYRCTGLHFLDGYLSIMSSYAMFTMSLHKVVLSPVQVKQFHFNKPTFKMKWELLLVLICFSSSMLRTRIVSWMPGLRPPQAQIADRRANIGALCACSAHREGRPRQWRLWACEYPLRWHLAFNLALLESRFV